MERSTILKEYFELRDHLNRANKISNQKTEIRFEIERTNLFHYRLFAGAHGQHELHKLAIAERNQRKVWERTGNTKFKNFEEFCADFLNEEDSLKENPIRHFQLSNQTSKYLADQLSENLRMLLLGKNYEP